MDLHPWDRQSMDLHPGTDSLWTYTDGPPMQFEAGNKTGGHYCCVGCEAHSSRFDDLAYCFHAHRPTLVERQDFILQGEA